MREAKNKLTELARRVEKGETITVTRHGKPVLEMAAPKFSLKKANAAIDQLKKKFGVSSLISYVAPDFDAPLPEDFLLKPLPERSLPKRAIAKRAVPVPKGRPPKRVRG